MEIEESSKTFTIFHSFNKNNFVTSIFASFYVNKLYLSVFENFPRWGKNRCNNPKKKKNPLFFLEENPNISGKVYSKVANDRI